MDLRKRVAIGCVIGLCAMAAMASAQQAAAPAALPATIPIFPLPDGVLFPNTTLPFHIFEPRYREMVADAIAGNRIIGMVTLQPGFESDYEGRPPIHPIGCAGIITDFERLPDGRYLIALRGVVKFRVTGEDRTRPYRLAHVTAMPELPDDKEKAALRMARPRLEAALSGALQGTEPKYPAEMPDEDVVNQISLYLGIEPADRQALLEQPGVLARAQALIGLLDMNAAPAPLIRP